LFTGGGSSPGLAAVTPVAPGLGSNRLGGGGRTSVTGRIVVGIDGSPQSGNALEWAVARARLGGEQLELVNAYNLPLNLDFYGYQGLAASHPMEWMTEFSTQLLVVDLPDS
jgi:hypothetical protein